MITIKALLNKINWDKNLDQKDYFLYYYDRVSSDLKEIRFVDIDKIDDNFLVVHKNSKKIHIPLHRIRKVKEKNKIIWQR